MNSRAGFFGIVLAAIIVLVSCRTATPLAYKDDPGLTPLMNAAWHNDLPRVQELLSHGANVAERTSNGKTALYEAIERTDLNADNLPIVDALLKAGADPNEAEFFTSNPLALGRGRRAT